MRRKKLILTVVLLFIGINSFLVYVDNKDRVPRLSYIKDWTETFQKDMYETIETAGVLSTVEEKNVYFDQDKGTFAEFLVEEDTAVNIGDDLFTYQVNHYAETMADLEREQEKLTGEIQAIEAALDSIAAYTIPETDMNTEFEDENSSLDMTSRSVDAHYMKEQYITEKETELMQKEAELQSVQAQISELETTGETITVESPYQGQVTAVSETLTNPVITIRDPELQAEGELTESERMEVEQNMPVEVAIRENDAVLQGNLSHINDTPKNTSIHRSSVYSFAVSLEDERGGADRPAEAIVENDVSEAPAEAEEIEKPEDALETEEAESSQQDKDSNQPEEGESSATEGLLPGYHADLSIITNESPKATAVREGQLFNGHLWKLTREGLLAKQPVETGLQMDNIVEITEGANPGEWIAGSDQDQFRDGAVFMTPLELDDIEWKDPGKYDNVNWKRYFLIGLLSR